MKAKQNPQSLIAKRSSPYPEVNLFIGILREAWCDALLPQQNNFYRERERQDARKFMEGTEKDWNQSFETICGLLNIEAALFRKGFFDFKRHYGNNQFFKPEDAFNTFIWTLFDD